jgi:[protein-PII] uridylyltransferase
MTLLSFDTAPPRKRARSRNEPGRDAIIDREKLDADIAALAEQHGNDKDAFRKAAVVRFREALEAGRAMARQILDENGKGLACAGRLSHLQDELIRAIYKYVITYIYPSPYPTAAERLCVAAVGGYGRDTLAPGSDIDLCLVAPTLGLGELLQLQARLDDLGCVPWSGVKAEACDLIGDQ